ncbi:MAG TPA: trypsin-like serine protease [Aldersonia sp.]
MRRHSLATARRVAIIGAAIALPLGASTTTVSAAPDPDAGLSDQAAHLPVELAEALQHDLQLTPEEYLRRSELAQQLAAFADIAKVQYPDAFSGSWLDSSGRPQVGVAPGPQAAPARTAIEQAGFGVVEVAKSESTLETELDALRNWLATQAPTIAAAVRGASIDPVSNSVVVHVADLPGGLQLPDFLPPLKILVTPAPQDAPTEPVPAADPVAEALPSTAMAGGDAYVSVLNNNGMRCSLGFNGTRGGQVVNITAGHCNPDLPAAGGPNAASVYELRQFDILGPKIGTFARSSLDSRDFSIIAINNASAARFQNNGVRVPGAAPLFVDGVAQPVVGAPVCKSGSRTGFSCGTVAAVDATVKVGERQLTGAFASTICALPGDSGGPIVTGTKALGVSSASSVADYPVCDIPNILGQLTGDTPMLFATPVATIIAENPGLQVRAS